MRRVPTFDELMWPALLALKSMGGSASNEELLNRVTEIAGVGDDIASILHTDNRQSRLNYNLAWAKTYLKKVGAVDNGRRGVWAITERGEAMSENDMASVPVMVRSSYNDRRGSEDAGYSENQEPNDEADSEIAHWRSELIQTLKSISPDAFERLAQRMLREAGFVKVEVTGRSGDGGIDGVGVLRLNLLSFITLFQCKRYSGTVGAAAVRDFRGAMIGRSDKGLIITTGTFTAEARREATRDGAPAIELIDADQLCTLLKDLKLGVKTELVEKVSVDRAWIEQI